MDSGDENGFDSGNVSSEEEDNYDFMEVDAAIQRSSSNNQNDPLEYPYEVLTTEEIVQHMLDCIKEVTNVVEVNQLIDNFPFHSHISYIFLSECTVT
jgi:ariadne-1